MMCWEINGSTARASKRELLTSPVPLPQNYVYLSPSVFSLLDNGGKLAEDLLQGGSSDRFAVQ